MEIAARVPEGMAGGRGPGGGQSDKILQSDGKRTGDISRGHLLPTEYRIIQAFGPDRNGPDVSSVIFAFANEKPY